MWMNLIELLKFTKNDYKVRKELQKDRSLIAMAGSKSKLKKLLEDETEFVKNGGNGS